MFSKEPVYYKSVLPSQEIRGLLHKKQIFSGNLLDKDDLAKIIFDLCQDHWGHLNGACIDLNGGQYLR